MALSRERILTLGLKNPDRTEVPRWLATARSVGHGSVRRVTRQRFDGTIRPPLAPPVCPEGWSIGPPSFVGVGAQRCGTTRWFDLLSAHPEVIPPTVTKELGYFDRFYTGGFTMADARGYHEYFPRNDNRKVGEWSPLYMCAPWIPRQLATAAPETRILVLLRDPVERYLSGLQHGTRTARENGGLLTELAPLESFMRGLYHAQILQLTGYFDRSQILILQYERCVQQPLVELRRTFEFLQLKDTGFAPDVEAHPHYQPKKPQLDKQTLDAYVKAYADDVTRLGEAFPEVDISLWPNFAHLVS